MSKAEAQKPHSMLLFLSVRYHLCADWFILRSAKFRDVTLFSLWCVMDLEIPASIHLALLQNCFHVEMVLQLRAFSLQAF